MCVLLLSVLIVTEGLQNVRVDKGLRNYLALLLILHMRELKFREVKQNYPGSRTNESRSLSHTCSIIPLYPNDFPGSTNNSNGHKNVFSYFINSYLKIDMEVSLDNW